ncbi:hypothetical protein [Pseudomonas saponiphila]|uniref:hypothetical protein n=1 Tax=Pseudomonas saponiphila TaxID=556534 RepID=UPI001428BC04|nr:hypothetical protein [Pseudomonas saponiphila]
MEWNEDIEIMATALSEEVLISLGRFVATWVDVYQKPAGMEVHARRMPQGSSRLA